VNVIHVRCRCRCHCCCCCCCCRCCRQDLLKDHLVVTLFLTMLVGAGGNAGNQSAIKVIRGLVRGAGRGGQGVCFLGAHVPESVCVRGGGRGRRTVSDDAGGCWGQRWQPKRDQCHPRTGQGLAVCVCGGGGSGDCGGVGEGLCACLSSGGVSGGGGLHLGTECATCALAAVHRSWVQRIQCYTHSDESGLLVMTPAIASPAY
jgi:hypothetical protein